MIGARRAALLVLCAGLALSPPGAEATGGDTLEELRALTELEVLDRQISRLQDEVVRLSVEAAEAEHAERTHGEDLATAEASIALLRISAGERLRAIYHLQRRGMARLLFSAASPAELRTRARYLQALMAADRAKLDEHLKVLAVRTADAAKIKTDKERSIAARDALTARQAELQEERAGKLTWLKKLRRENSAALARERDVAKAAFDNQVRELQPGPAALDDPESDARVASARFEGKKGRLPTPVEGTVTRGYGRYADKDGVSVHNPGLDFSAASMSPFRAVADGEVVRSGYVKPHGQTVIVQHGTYVSVYAHANGLQVAQGDWVQAGQVLGLVGSSGLTESSDGQLHFEIRENGMSQDPAAWLSKSSLRCARDVTVCR